MAHQSILIAIIAIGLIQIISPVHSFGDVFSGITGQAPESLTFPSSTLDRTNIDPSKTNVDLQCIYKASRDGWSAIDFHENVDSRGSALVVCLSKSGKKFGGYCPTGWMSTDDYVGSNAAFLWCQQGSDAVKYPVLQGGNVALFDYASAGPVFGAADLKIGQSQSAIMGGFAGPDVEDRSISAGNLKRGTSNIGGAYENVENSWPVRGKFQLVELEVYANANISPIGQGNNGGGFKLWPF